MIKNHPARRQWEIIQYQENSMDVFTDLFMQNRAM